MNEKKINYGHVLPGETDEKILKLMIMTSGSQTN